MTTCPFFVDDVRPFAQRRDGMSLDVIHPRDVPRGKVPFIKDEDKSLTTSDIARAEPFFPHLQYLARPDYSVGNTNPDHVGSRARTYYPPMDRRPRDLSLTTADIELAQARGKRYRGNRHTDPVCPNYQLPSCEVREPTPPKFNGRQLHEISDIKGTSPMVRIPYRNYSRDPNDSSDIEFASASYEERRRQMRGRPRADRSLDVKDIMDVKPANQRGTNPLEPSYFGESPVEQVPGSKPRRLTWDNGEPQFSLLREDIAGTVPQRWVGCVPTNIYDPPEAKPMISFHDPHDIPGAQVGSLKKGIEGSRRGGTTNPLNPRYKMLDGDTKPQPAPVIDAGRPGVLHPLVSGGGGGGRGMQHSMSLPGLRGGQAGSAAGSVPSTGRSGMRRDASDGAIRRGAPQQDPFGTTIRPPRDDVCSTPASSAGGYLGDRGFQ